MQNPFVQRRPWAAAIISIVFGPFVGMLYLNRGQLSLGYFAAEFVATASALAYQPFDGHGHPSTAIFWLFVAPVRIVGAIHSVLIARRWQTDQIRHWYARWYAIVAILLAFPATALLIRTFLYQPFNAPSSSMSPTINVGDYFVVSKFAYDFQSPQRGDVVVFRVKNMDNADFVKRIIGLPGDRVWMKRGLLYINGHAARVRRISDFAESCIVKSCDIPQYVETLPGGRTERILDLVPDGPMDDTLVFSVPADSYFVLGDNRDNSMDSRSDQVRFVPRGSILGRAVRKFAAGGHLTWKPIR
jgi:signal peptidase I